MPPAARHRPVTLSRCSVISKIGRWVVEGDDDGLSRIYLPNESVRATKGVASGPVVDAARQLEEYFNGRRLYFDVDLHACGTEFQQEVWIALAAIPYGVVHSYGQVAEAVGRPNAYRAVGNANAKNPWPIIVPCHRVVASSSVGGYAGGLDVKRFLLRLEGIDRY